MNKKTTYAQLFLRHFKTNQNGFVSYILEEHNSKKNKQEATYFMNKESIQNDDIIHHFEGKRGVGVCPITSNNTINFACIDIDDYECDIERIDNDINALNLPLIICKSKSNGLHLFLFIEETKNIKKTLEILEFYAKKLKLNKYELFPKQNYLDKNSIGNTINLPYFNIDNEDYSQACYNNGDYIDLEHFCSLIDVMKINIDKINNIQEEFSDNIEKINNMINVEYQDAPPCIKTILVRGEILEGERSNSLFAIGTYLKMKFETDWERRLRVINLEYIKTSPFEDKDLIKMIINPLKQKPYTYKCSDIPLINLCDKAKCKTCPYGKFSKKNDLENISNDLSIDHMQIIKTLDTKFSGRETTTFMLTYHSQQKGIKNIKVDSVETLNSAKKMSYTIQSQIGEYVKLDQNMWEKRLIVLYDQAETIDLDEQYDSNKITLKNTLKTFLSRKNDNYPACILTSRVYKCKKNEENIICFAFDKFLDFYKETVGRSSEMNTGTIYMGLLDWGLGKITLEQNFDDKETIYIDAVYMPESFIEDVQKIKIIKQYEMEKRNLENKSEE